MFFAILIRLAHTEEDVVVSHVLSLTAAILYILRHKKEKETPQRRLTLRQAMFLQYCFYVCYALVVFFPVLCSCQVKM